tara:strand:- start:383 stop:505 length:123 start_codon:yes stop_codon:yes gene_type:complete
MKKEIQKECITVSIDYCEKRYSIVSGNGSSTSKKENRLAV